LHCSNMCHAANLVTQRQVDCVQPSGMLANHVLHVLFVATMYAVCLILYRYVCLQVLSRQQTAGRCTSCAKWPCSQVSPPCLSSKQADNPALCIYFKTALLNCLKKSPTKNPLLGGLHAATENDGAWLLHQFSTESSKNQNSILYIKSPSQRASFQPFSSPKVRPSLFAAKLGTAVKGRPRTFTIIILRSRSQQAKRKKPPKNVQPTDN